MPSPDQSQRRHGLSRPHLSKLNVKPDNILIISRNSQAAMFRSTASADTCTRYNIRPHPPDTPQIYIHYGFKFVSQDISVTSVVLQQQQEIARWLLESVLFLSWRLRA